MSDNIDNVCKDWMKFGIKLGLAATGCSDWVDLSDERIELLYRRRLRQQRDELKNIIQVL